MKFLVIGSGGREHAIYWRLLNDGSASEAYVLPGNGGIPVNNRVNMAQDDFVAIEKFCKDKGIDIVVVGPEAPLVGGLVDYLSAKGIKAFGPSAKGAQLEGSKIFAKMIMEKYNIPTAGYHEFTSKKDLLDYIDSNPDYPLVIKLDGLAAGKGVGIPNNRAEALAFINDMVKENSKVFVEDFLEGEEASVLGISDGNTILPFIAAQDHKRVFDNDCGPNTGGMGAYAPAPVVDDAMLVRVKNEVLQPVIDGMNKEGIPFKGILYAGLMIKDNDIQVLEFNARFGDPETQVLLPLIDGKLGDLFLKSIEGTLKEGDLKFKKEHAMTVVMASGGYPGNYEKGKPIDGLDLTLNNVMVFHAGTELSNGKVVTNGGRVLTITGIGLSLQEARDKAYDMIKNIKFADAHYRKDIGHRAL